MLVLTRKLNESIIINGNIRVTVIAIRGNQIRLGIEAPGEVPIYREELLQANQTSEEQAETSPARKPRPLAGSVC
jgi:carbon storage regulator